MGAGGEGLEDVDVVPGNVVSGGEGVMSWSRFHSVCSVVNCVIQSVASLVFFHSVEEGAVGLSVVLGGAVEAADLVDGVGSLGGGRSSLCLGEEVPEGGVGGEGDVDVVVVEDLLDGFGEGGMEGEEGLQGGSWFDVSVEGSERLVGGGIVELLGDLCHDGGDAGGRESVL